VMKEFRPVDDAVSVTSGPGKLTQALKITAALNGVDVTNPRSELHIELGIKPVRVIATSRIGITRAVDREWRFIDPSSPYLSRKIQIKAL
jgi:DNA-3-methyladenine glycosylase